MVLWCCSHLVWLVLRVPPLHALVFIRKTFLVTCIYCYSLQCCSAAIHSVKFVFITAQFIMVHLGSDTPYRYTVCVNTPTVSLLLISHSYTATVFPTSQLVRLEVSIHQIFVASYPVYIPYSLQLTPPLFVN